MPDTEETPAAGTAGQNAAGQPAADATKAEHQKPEPGPATKRWPLQGKPNPHLGADGQPLAPAAPAAGAQGGPMAQWQQRGQFARPGMQGGGMQGGGMQGGGMQGGG